MINKLISLVIITFFLLTSHSYSENQFLFPKKKPSIFKKIDKKIGQNYSKDLPQRKPIIQQNDVPKNEVIVKKDLSEKKKVKEKEKIKNQVMIVKPKNTFLLPQKKPSIHTVSAKTLKKSSILNQKDFENAKETIKFIKAKKWNSALKSAAKVKDREFRI